MKKIILIATLIIAVGSIWSATSNPKSQETIIPFEFSVTPQFYPDIENKLMKLLGEHRLSKGLRAGNVVDETLQANVRNRALEIYNYGLSVHKKEHFIRLQSNELFCKCENVSYFETRNQKYSAEDWAKIILNLNTENNVFFIAGAHTVCGVSIYGDKNKLYVAMNFASKKLGDV